MNLENEKKESFKKKLDNILFNVKWVAIVCACVFVKVLFDSANYEVENENENKIIINVMMSDSLGSKIIAVKEIK